MERSRPERKAQLMEELGRMPTRANARKIALPKPRARRAAKKSSRPAAHKKTASSRTKAARKAQPQRARKTTRNRASRSRS
jgi:hypothetical protein